MELKNGGHIIAGCCQIQSRDRTRLEALESLQLLHTGQEVVKVANKVDEVTGKKKKKEERKTKKV